MTDVIDAPAPAQGRSEPPVTRPRWFVPALVLGYLVQVAWRLWLVRHLNAPAAHADEDGYLLAARVLAGGPGGMSSENEAFRRTGYPLMLSPIYWFTSDAFAVYRGAQVVNALTSALMLPLGYLFGRRVLGLERGWALGGGFVAAATVAVVFYTQFAMTDAVIAPIATGWLLLVHAWLGAGTPRGRWLTAVGSGAAAGLVYAVHVRGTLIVGVHLLVVAAAVVVLRRVRLGPAAASVAAMFVVAGLDPVLKYVIGNAIGRVGRSPKQQTIEAVTTLGGIGRMLGDGTGQLWYLFVATLGLGAVGMVAAGIRLWPDRGLLARLRDDPALVVLATMLFTTLFIAYSSAAALPPSDGRLNYHAYIRYIHFLLPLWLLAGFAALRAVRGRRDTVRLVGGAAALVAVTAAVTYYRFATTRHHLFLPFDAPETSYLAQRWDRMEVLRTTLVAAVAFGLIAVAVRWRRGAAAVLVALTLLSGLTMVESVRRISEPAVLWQYPPGTVRLDRLGLRHDEKIAASWAMNYHLPWNHMREVYWTRLMMFDSRKEPPPPGADVVVAPWHSTRDRDWDGTRYGYHLIASDRRQQFGVWHR
jgi:hypothetical protein